MVPNLTVKDLSKSEPIKSKTGKVLSSVEQQNQRLVKHFSEVLNQPNPDLHFNFTNENDIDGNNSNIILDDLTCDKLSEAIKLLENNKESVLTIYQLNFSNIAVMQSFANLQNQELSSGAQRKH